MKNLCSALLFGLLLSLTATAWAQDANTQAGDGSAAEGDAHPVPTRFYDFNEMLIDGEFMRPEGLFTRARDRARFQRLLDLRREFMDEIEESAKEDALQ